MPIAKYIVAYFLAVALVWPKAPIARGPSMDQQERMAMDLAFLSELVQCFAQDYGRLPSDWAELTTAQPELYFEIVPLDPWGNEYYLDSIADSNRLAVGSYGRDNQPGGTGEDADTEVVVRSGRKDC